MADILLNYKPELLQQLNYGKWHTEIITSSSNSRFMFILDLLRYDGHCLILKTICINNEFITSNSSLIRIKGHKFVEFKLSTELTNRDDIKTLLQNRFSDLVYKAESRCRDKKFEYTASELNGWELCVPTRNGYLVNVAA